MYLGLIFLLGCGIQVPTNKISQENIYKLQKKNQYLIKKAPTCHYPDFIGPSKDTCKTGPNKGTGDGDMMLYGGLLCLSGYDPGCELVKRSCDSESCFRSPARVNNDEPPTFSRDMLVGVFAYTVKTGDVSLAKLLMNKVKITGKLCESAFYCDLRPSVAGLFYDVMSRFGEKTHILFKMASLIDDEILYFSSKINPVGYTMELIATQVLLSQRLQTYSSTHSDALEVLIERWPSNPYFHFVKHRADDTFTEDILMRIPVDRPKHADSWSFQTGNEERSMLWEWVYLTNLMLEK